MVLQKKPSLSIFEKIEKKKDQTIQFVKDATEFVKKYAWSIAFGFCFIMFLNNRVFVDEVDRLSDNTTNLGVVICAFCAIIAYLTA
jgi:hypothetical protein